MLFSDFIRNIFKKRSDKHIVLSLPSLVNNHISSLSLQDSPFIDNFSKLDLTNWFISSGIAPCSNKSHTGIFSYSNVSVKNGILCLKLTQDKNTDETYNSVGAEITTFKYFGFGTYEFIVKMSSDSNNKSVSGSVSGIFNYLDNSETEIDIEVEGSTRSSIIQFTTRKFNNKPEEHSIYNPLIPPYIGFHTYKFIWTPSEITFMVDGYKVSIHKDIVPISPSPISLSHWGTHDSKYGGVATPGIDRYMYIKKFSYIPL